ncbi:hypothetical protein J6590_061570 [Homalodisca vitripennis]|nr:hypothetical protein J6590_061570 [Homalodisca vitripennis]
MPIGYNRQLKPITYFSSPLWNGLLSSLPGIRDKPRIKEKNSLGLGEWQVMPGQSGFANKEWQINARLNLTTKRQSSHLFFVLLGQESYKLHLRCFWCDEIFRWVRG